MHAIRLSWRNILLAPLVVPLVVACLFTISSPGNSPAFAFAFFLILGGVISYGATIFLLLPGLYALSRVVTLRWDWVLLAGMVLGIAAFVPLAWMSFRSSGPDSGPPVGTFSEYLWRSRTDFVTWLFPVAGGVTALAYWLFAPRQSICAKS